MPKACTRLWAAREVPSFRCAGWEKGRTSSRQGQEGGGPWDLFRCSPWSFFQSMPLVVVLVTIFGPFSRLTKCFPIPIVSAIHAGFYHSHFASSKEALWGARGTWERERKQSNPGPGEKNVNNTQLLPRSIWYSLSCSSTRKDILCLCHQVTNTEWKYEN